MSFLKKLASDTALYGLSSLLARMLNFALVPFHTTVFEAESYGIVAEFYAYAVFLNVIFTYGMETAFFRFANDARYSPLQVYRVGMTSLIFTTIAFSGGLFLGADALVAQMGYAGQGYFVRWFALILGVDALMVLPFAYLRFQNRAKKFAFVKSLNIVINIGLNVFFLALLPQAYAGEISASWQAFAQRFYVPEVGVGYVFLANLIANLCFIPLLIKEIALFRFRFDGSLFRAMWGYSYPLVFTGLAYAINEVADRNLLKYWLPENFYPGKTSMEALGIYSACYRLSIFISLGVQAFKYAAEPFFFSEGKMQDGKEKFAVLFKYFTLTLLLMFVGVSLSLDVLQFFLRQETYRVGLSVVPILLFANVCLGVYYNLSAWFKLTDKTYYGTFFSLIGAAFTLALNFLLIPVLGYHGSALATLACYGSMCILTYVYGQRHYPVPYPLGEVLGYALFAVLLVAAGWLWYPESYVLRLSYRVVLGSLFLGVVFVREVPNLRGRKSENKV